MATNRVNNWSRWKPGVKQRFFMKLKECHWIYYKLNSFQCSRFHYRAVTASSGSSPRMEDNGLRNQVRENLFHPQRPKGILLMRGSLAGRLERWTCGQTFLLTAPSFTTFSLEYLCSFFFFYSVIHLFIHAFLSPSARRAPSPRGKLGGRKSRDC